MNNNHRTKIFLNFLTRIYFSSLIKNYRQLGIVDVSDKETFLLVSEQ